MRRIKFCAGHRLYQLGGKCEFFHGHRACKYFDLPYNPTAENMVRFLLEFVCPELLKGTSVHATRVVIWETAEAFAGARTPSSIAQTLSAPAGAVTVE